MKHLLLFLLLLTCSCVSVQKASKVMRNHPLELAELCSETFPIKEEVIQGETITVTDTVEVPGAVLECPETTNPETGKVYKPTVQCPSGKTIIQTVTRTDTIIKIDSRETFKLQKKLEATETSLQATTSERDKAKKNARTWGISTIVLILIGAAFVVAMIRK